MNPLTFDLEFLWGPAQHSEWLSLLLIIVFSEVESIPPGPVWKPSLKDAGRLRHKFSVRSWQCSFTPHVFENILVTTNEGVNSEQCKNNVFKLCYFELDKMCFLVGSFAVFLETGV